MLCIAIQFSVEAIRIGCAHHNYSSMKFYVVGVAFEKRYADDLEDMMDLHALYRALLYLQVSYLLQTDGTKQSS